MGSTPYQANPDHLIAPTTDNKLPSNKWPGEHPPKKIAYIVDIQPDTLKYNHSNRHQYENKETTEQHEQDADASDEKLPQCDNTRQTMAVKRDRRDRRDKVNTKEPHYRSSEKELERDTFMEARRDRLTNAHSEPYGWFADFDLKTDPTVEFS